MQRSPHFLIPAEAGNLSVDQTQGVSLYIQVANILRYAILSGVIVSFLQIDTLTHKNSNRDKHLQNRLSRTRCAFGAD